MHLAYHFPFEIFHSQHSVIGKQEIYCLTRRINISLFTAKRCYCQKCVLHDRGIGKNRKQSNGNLMKKNDITPMHITLNNEGMHIDIVKIII